MVLVEDHAAPVVSICLTYDVGSRNEKAGRTGFAHLFEHMMFQGSENIGKGEHFALVGNNGGTMNGSTNADRTNYYQTLPANQLDLALFLEADRMRSLAITPANFENQRRTVKEERQQNYDNRAYGRSQELLHETMYDNFAYKHSTIGSMADLDAATLEDARKFFTVYYAPNNAVLTLVGDFSSAVAMEKIKQLFGGIAAQKTPPEPDMAEPEQKEERRQMLDDRLARLTRVDIGFKVPAGNHPDFIALQALASILGGGRSSRLHRVLVDEKQVALAASAFAYERRGPGTFQFFATARPGHEAAEVEKMILDELAEVQRPKAIEDWELEKVKFASKRAAAEQLRSSLGRAVSMGQYAVYYGDPGLINRRAEQFAKVTREDLVRVAKKYLTAENRTVLVTRPARKAAQ